MGGVAEGEGQPPRGGGRPGAPHHPWRRGGWRPGPPRTGTRALWRGGGGAAGNAPVPARLATSRPLRPGGLGSCPHTYGHVVGHAHGVPIHAMTISLPMTMTMSISVLCTDVPTCPSWPHSVAALVAPRPLLPSHWGRSAHWGATAAPAARSSQPLQLPIAVRSPSGSPLLHRRPPPPPLPPPPPPQAVACAGAAAAGAAPLRSAFSLAGSSREAVAHTRWHTSGP